LLPEFIKISLKPRFEDSRNRLVIQYEIIERPLLQKIVKKLIHMYEGRLSKESFRINAEAITINIPNIEHIPYKIKNITVGEITITLQKEMRK